MLRKGLRLYKKEKLCSQTAISSLFLPGGNASRAIAFPLRAVWQMRPSRHADCPQFLIMVPKRRIRHAVDRVAMRRRIREAYRLNRHLIPADLRLDIAFVYIAPDLQPYCRIERAIERLLRSVAASVAPPSPQ